MTNPINPIIDEIRGALRAGFYFLPVVLSAAIPDMCAALESLDGRSSSSQYKAWFNKWMSSKMRFLTADDCYSFRCGIVHQGRMGDLKSGGVARVIFPIDPRNIFINSKMNDAYFCSPTVFCEDMIAGANDWYAVVGQSSNVLKNGALAMRIHPNGIFPYMVGGPVLG